MDTCYLKLDNFRTHFLTVLFNTKKPLKRLSLSPLRHIQGNWKASRLALFFKFSLCLFINN